MSYPLATMNPATLADGAERWARARGLAVPARGTAAWNGMFAAWQRTGMRPNAPTAAAGGSAYSANPELLVRHLYASEALANLLRSWGWHAVVERRPGGWTVNTNAPQAHVTEALRRAQVALETLPPTRNPADTVDFTEIANEQHLGALVSSRTKPVLDVLTRNFGGGRAFTRDELAHEATVLADGTRLSPATAAIRTGHALSELEKLGYVRRLGKELNAHGRPGPMRFVLTTEGEARGVAQQDVDAFDFGENLVAKQIDALESAAPPKRGGAPLSGAVYRPRIPVLDTKGHKLPDLQKRRIREAGYRTCNPGLDDELRALTREAATGDPIAIAKLERFKARLTGAASDAPAEMQRAGSTPGARVQLPIQQGDVFLQKDSRDAIYVYQARGLRMNGSPNLENVGNSATFQGKRFIKLYPTPGQPAVGQDAPEFTVARLWRPGREAEASAIVAKYLAPLLSPTARVHLTDYAGKHFSLAPALEAPKGRVKLTVQRPAKGASEVGSVDWAIEQIREGLKKRSGKAWSVKRGSGTSYGWIRIASPPARMDARGVMTQAEIDELSQLLGTRVHHQGESVPDQRDYRQEFVDRAWGRPPSVRGVARWMDNPARSAASCGAPVSSPESRVRQMGRGWWVRSFGSMTTVPSPFATKREALAYALRNEQFVKEFSGITDAHEAAVLAQLAPTPPARVKLSTIIAAAGNEPPGGWTDADRVPNPLTKAESQRFLDEAASLRHIGGQTLVRARKTRSPIYAVAAAQTFGHAEGLAAVVRHAGPKDRSMEGPALWGLKKAGTGDYHALRLAESLELAQHGRHVGPRTLNAPRSKKCREGYHDWEPATGLCRRAGCEAFHHAGQELLFGRDLDPTAVAEALERERLTGQRDMFGRLTNPLSVLVLGNAPSSPRGASRPRAGNPPAGTVGVREVRAHVREFHGAPVARWVRIDVEDGKPGHTHQAVSALGLTEATVYSTPWRRSNKHKRGEQDGGVWEHLHESRKPLEVYDPVGHVSIKLLQDGSGPSDWWRDDRMPRSANAGRRRRRTA